MLEGRGRGKRGVLGKWGREVIGVRLFVVKGREMGGSGREGGGGGGGGREVVEAVGWRKKRSKESLREGGEGIRLLVGDMMKKRWRKWRKRGRCGGVGEKGHPEMVWPH